MKSRPLILIAGGTDPEGPEFKDPSLTLSGRYTEAVLLHGGLPFILAPVPSARAIAESVRRCDAVVLSGGDDLQTSLYAAGLTPEIAAKAGRPDRERDLAESLLIQEVFHQRKPLLAICRGHQMLNVVFGGTLIVDLPSQRPAGLNHRRFDIPDEPGHEIALASGSLIRKLLRRPTAAVNTTHHQAVDRLAPLFRPTATSGDGIIEAFELAPEHAAALPWLLSVQFHPERLCLRQPEFGRIFSGLTRAARADARRRR
ncbi:MAG: gamma-glutamyl-gamma-aminobutyrate hydrolase family protein [Verrucomicrobiae bacterium]|nr:gamma-glutamyl-gamma-aminobutyrate hydrolase family protein [Verrucomicrobiae bacterium]MCP5524843.1 gamma-glutamyl-gamma-aminobutyrate hydrolase family protein [Verrucomicrobiales bacterium]